MIDVTTHALRR